MLLIRCFYILILSLSCVSSVYACPLNVATSGPWPIFQKKTQKGNWSGLNFDLLNAVLQPLGCDYQVKIVPWPRAIKLLEKGEVDLVFNFSRKPEREANYYFVGPYMTEKLAFIARKDISPEVNDISKLHYFNGLIGKINGAYLGKDLTSVWKDNPDLQDRTIYVADSAKRSKMLNKNRIDGTFENIVLIQQALNEGILDPNEFERRFTFSHNPVYFGLSKVSISLDVARKIDLSWRSLPRKEIRRIFAKYGLDYSDFAQ